MLPRLDAFFEFVGDSVYKICIAAGPCEVYQEGKRLAEGGEINEDTVLIFISTGVPGGFLIKRADKVIDVPNSATRLDYSSSFADDLVNFKPGYLHFSGQLDDDLILVQYHRSDRALGEGRSAAWWTTPEQGNVFQTIDDVRQNLALPPGWGPRDAVSIAKVPKGAEVEFFKGAAARQQANGVAFEGDGLQFRFKDFDESWIIDTRKIPGIGNE